MPAKLDRLLKEIRACKVCAASLPLGPKPIVSAKSTAKILIVGQAPGTKVHASGIPWDDASGDRLRNWMGISREIFYDPSKIAIVPMGFCYPGKGASGDLPPRPECAPLWHQKILELLPEIKLTLLIGQFAQNYYLQNKKNLTDTVKAFKTYGPKYFPLVHPSPRNQIWMKKNPWFEKTVIRELKKSVASILQVKLSF
ncbi:uracil-DNA glycosylase family protein [bacterium]|nr:uracil-DNA glycosylase family protein [bacterium]